MKLVFAIFVMFNNGVPVDWDIGGAIDTVEHCETMVHTVFEKNKAMIPEGMQLQVKCVDFAELKLIDSGFGPDRQLKPAPSEKSSER